jgi:hypothetical protein
MIGLESGIAYEFIAITMNGEKPYPAPLGAKEISEKMVTTIYWETPTYTNMKAIGTGTLNLCHDGTIYYQAVFEKEKLITRLKQDDKWWILYPSEGWVGFRVAHEEKEEAMKRSVFMLEISAVGEGDAEHTPYTRADGALIEMLIHHSRLKPYLRLGRRKDAEQLLSLIEYYASLVSRLATEGKYVAYARDVLHRSTEILGSHGVG